MSCVPVGVLGSGNLEVLIESAPHLARLVAAAA
jgi:hypothetical protein